MPHTPKPSLRYSIGAANFEAPTLPAGLYVTATPIGNLGDITIRGLETLAAVDLILCEDTRVTAKLLNRYGIRNNLAPYHDHNAAKVRPGLVARIGQGEAVALVSDAGMPLLSDPGYKLVNAVLAAGHRVTIIPGASAILTALAASALPPDRFMFCGFLPVRPGPRRAILEDVKTAQASLVFFETAPRLAETLADIADILGNRPVAVGRELTKLHEEIMRGAARDVLAGLARRDNLKGEITLVVGPPGEHSAAAHQDDVDSALRETLASMPASRAAADVARRFGLSKKQCYDRLLELRQNG
jgi:16S rRNA (cytidine1402-2'-O)-methyltransferase